MVEMALVLPLFLTLILGMIEFGRAMMIANLVTNAAREGARMAVLDGSSNTTVTDGIKTFLQSAIGVTVLSSDIGVTITVTPAAGNPNVGNVIDKALWEKVPCVTNSLVRKSLSASFRIIPFKFQRLKPQPPDAVLIVSKRSSSRTGKRFVKPRNFSRMKQCGGMCVGGSQFVGPLRKVTANDLDENFANPTFPFEEPWR